MSCWAIDWNAIGAVGTCASTIAALYLGLRRDKPRIKVWIEYVPEGSVANTPMPPRLQVHVANLGGVPIEVTGLRCFVGYVHRDYFLFDGGQFWGSPLPSTLAPARQKAWSFPLEATKGHWLKMLPRLARYHRMRWQITTSANDIVTAKASYGVQRVIRASVLAVQAERRRQETEFADFMNP